MLKYDKTKYDIVVDSNLELVIKHKEPIIEGSSIPAPPSIVYNKNTGDLEIN